MVNTHVDHPCCITLFEVEQHSRFVEEGEHRHVLNLIEFWRVLRMDVTVLMGYSLKRFTTERQVTSQLRTLLFKIMEKI